MPHDLFDDEQPKISTVTKPKLPSRRRLFLLVFAVALLWQTLLVMQTRLSQYYAEMNQSFKVILTVDSPMDISALTQLEEALKQKSEIAEVKLFSPTEGLKVLQQQHAQLAQSLLAMSTNQMPAYVELRLVPTALHSIDTVLAQITTTYKWLTPHYNASHAQLLFTTGLCLKLLQVSMGLALLVFLVFMFLVEAYPSRQTCAHFVGGMVSGVLAALGAWVFFVVIVYPTGFLNHSLWMLTVPGKQVLLIAFCAILGWTLSKWQKF